uniref:hypothetical protein n=1 Tax=Bernardetia sp. TaxID=1937974 RepID=UPI0025C6EA4C
LIFEEGKLLQVDKEGGSTNKYIYQNEKIVRVESYDEKDTTYLIATYNEDSVKYVVPSPVVMLFNNKNFVGCNDVSEGYSCCCVYYQGDTIFQDGSKWIFLKDKVITEYHPMGKFPNFDNYKKAFFVRDGYVNIIVENVITKEQLKNPFLEGDFESEEKREIKIKILKSPADTPKKEEIIEVENDIELDDN